MPDSTLPAYFTTGKTLYALLYLGWVALIYRSGRLRGLFVPTLLAVLGWFLLDLPLERLYALGPNMDRQRNLAWCATAAAGNAPWGSGVVGRYNLEPWWALLVASLSLFDPGRVMTVYRYLPPVAIALVGASFTLAFRTPRVRAAENDSDGEAPWLALLVVFFVLLAPTGPLDYLSPYRAFWQRTFLLKPNHAFGFALLPVLAWLVASRGGGGRAVATALVLGTLGWVFVVHWALVCGGLGLYAVVIAWRDWRGSRSELWTIVVIVAVSLVLVAPYLYYLMRSFPVVSFPPPVYRDEPQRSVWGEAPSRTHSLLFLVTLDLGINFLLACYGAWVSWTRRTRMHLLWLGFAASAYLAWALNAYLLSIGQARVSDEIYFFLVVAVAVQAAIGLEDVLARVAERTADAGPAILGSRARVFALALACWLPLTFPWWWNAPRMDPHFRISREPLPDDLTNLATWIRENTEGSDVFLAGTDVATWIPALTGRRVLRTGMPWAGTEAYELERRLLLSEDPEAARAVLDAMRVDYVVLDLSLRDEHELTASRLDESPLFDLVFQSYHTRIYRARRARESVVPDVVGVR